MCSRVIRGFCMLNGAIFNKTVPTRCCRRFLASTAETDKSQKDGASPSTDGETTSPDGSTEAAAFDVERKKLLADLAVVQDKYQRALAETENVRARMHRQLDDARIFSVQAFVKDLLEVADILGQATDSVPADTLAAADANLRALHSGLAMTRTQLMKIFARHGVVEIAPAVGEKFDPYVHEALFQQPAGGQGGEGEGREANTVAVLTKVGYRLHSRTVRPAVVGVFKA